MKDRSSSRRAVSRAAVALIATAVGFASLSSCGSGVIGGILASRDRSGTNTGQVQPPQILVDRQAIPLIEDWLPPLSVLVTLRIPGYVLSQEAEPTISIAADTIGLTRTASRTRAAFTSVDPVTRTTTFRAFVDINLVRALLVVPDRSVDAYLHAEADGIDIAPPTTVRFVEPGEVIAKGGNQLGGAIVVSVDGTSRLRLTANKILAATSEAANVELSVLQRNYQAPRLVGGEFNLDAQRRVAALGKSYERDATTGISLIDGVAPAASFPGIARVLLRGPESGVALDTLGGKKALDLPRVLYVPSLRAVGPASLPVEGGVQARLVGRGLVPAQHEERFEYLFDRVSLSIEKRGATTDVKSEAIFRDESTEQGIVFRMPESPDGLPGNGAVVLTQLLGDNGEIEYVSRLEENPIGVRFARSDPQLGPFVSDVSASVTHLTSGNYRESSPYGEDAIAMRTDAQGTGRVTLLRNQGSGLFREIATVSTGVRDARRLLSGPFDGTDPDDLFAVAGSTINGFANHALMAGVVSSGSILEPFRKVDRGPVEFATDGDVADAAEGDFDGDGSPDVVILRVDPAKPPIELWSRLSDRVPLRTDFGTAGTKRTRLHIADLDGDGSLDVAYDEHTVYRDVVIHYGNGNGGFVRTERVRWGTDAALTQTAPTILTSVRARLAATTRRHLVVGAEVLRSSSATSAWLGLLVNRGNGFDPVASTTTLVVGSSPVFEFHERLDLDDDGNDELVCTSSNAGLGAPLHAFEFGTGRPVILTSGETDGELLRGTNAIVRSEMRMGSIVRDALLVQHDDYYGTSRQPVVSTFIVSGGRLHSRVPRLPTAADPQRIVIGDFDGDRVADDVAWFDDRGLSAAYFSAPGAFEPPFGFDQPLSMTSILSSTLVALPNAAGSRFAWLTRDGRIRVFDPSTKVTLESGDVRRLFGSGGSSLELDDRSQVLVVDPNGDDEHDLVVLLRSKPVGERSEVRLAFFRGKDVAADEFPFVEPSKALVLDSAALAIDTGNMTGHDSSRPGLEVAYDTGDRVHFASLTLDSTSGEDVFIAMPALTLASTTFSQSPRLVDLDEDGRDDVAVLAPDARGVRVWFNRLRWTGTGLEGQLVQLGGSLLAFPGDPIGMEAVDMNGDGLRDLLVVSQLVEGTSIRPVLTLFRNQDRGALGLAYVFGGRWIGQTVPRTFATADLDGNGMTDIVFGNRILLCR